MLVGGLFASPSAGAGEPILSVRVLDQETGREISDPQCALVDPVRRVVRATFAGAVYRGNVAPRAGDALLVYGRGYDLARLVLEPGARTATVRLRRARTCEVRVVSGAYPSLPVAVSVQMPSAWKPSPIQEVYRTTFPADGRLEVAVPAGLQPFVVVEPDADDCVWPRAFWVQAGGTYGVNVEAPRLLEVRRDGNLPRFRTWGVEIYADLIWTPPLEPARIDAWRSTVYSGGWLGMVFRRAGETMPVLPDAPFHFFASLDGQPVYRYVSRTDDVLDLRRPFTSKVVARRPLVNGQPAPAGTLLAPGRLDLYTVMDVWNHRLIVECCYRTARADEDEWPEVRLPPSEWLTIWHEDHGLAHVAWRQGCTPKGRTYPGRLTVTAPEGFSATGYVSAYPTWKGSGEWHLAPVEKYLRRQFEGRRWVRFPGLRPAHYGLDIHVRLTEAATGRVVEVQQMREISVTEKDLAPTYRLSAAGK